MRRMCWPDAAQHHSARRYSARSKGRIKTGTAQERHDSAGPDPVAGVGDVSKPPIWTGGVRSCLLGEQVSAVAAGGWCCRGNQPVTNQFAQKRAEGGEGFARPLGDLLNSQWLPRVENGQDLPPGSGGRHAQLRIGEYIRAVIHADQKLLVKVGDGPASVETAGIPDLNADRLRSQCHCHLSEVVIL